VRSTLDLLDLPFTFSQLPALTEHQFISAARERGLHLTPQLLEGFHRLGILVPLFRLRRRGRSIAAAARRGDGSFWEERIWHPTGRDGLLLARENDLLRDPAEERFIRRATHQREVAGVRYNLSAYLYSEHQLLLLPLLREALPHLRYDDRGEIATADVHRVFLANWRTTAAALREVVLALSSLEPLYYPGIVGIFRGWEDEMEAIERWRRRTAVRGMLAWIGVDPDWLTGRATGLLEQADRIDPLGPWLSVVREADRSRWKDLRGEARSAIDLRIGAEVLLAYYERLARGRIAPRLRKPAGRERDPLGTRLGSRRDLDGVLTEFGLSPHPHLLLVLEGETELFIFPRVMAHFGIRPERSFISLHNARGVDGDLSALVAYAVAPVVEEDDHGRYLGLVRPPTRLLATMDAEGRFATPADRERRRQKWITRIAETLPVRYRTGSVLDSLDKLVEVSTWNAKGESFEFANFTDRELATAIHSLDSRPRRPDLPRLRGLVSEARTEKRNLQSLGAFSKVTLAESLWPVLERKIEQRRKRGTVDRIPVVALLDRATDLARELPRRNVVIPLRPDA
jgi:hypothetical protein